MNNELEKLKWDAERSLECLYITVEQIVADDVNKKVKAYIEKLESMISEKQNLTDIEKSKGRSPTYWDMNPEEQWAEDKRLGILDWDGK